MEDIMTREESVPAHTHCACRPVVAAACALLNYAKRVNFDRNSKKWHKADDCTHRRLRLFIDLMLLSDEPRMQCRYLANSIDRLEKAWKTFCGRSHPVPHELLDEIWKIKSDA